MVKSIKYSCLDYYNRFGKALLLLLVGITGCVVINDLQLLNIDNVVIAYIAGFISIIASTGYAIFLVFAYFSVIYQLYNRDGANTRYFVNSMPLKPSEQVVGRIIDSMIVFCTLALSVVLSALLARIVVGKGLYLDGYLVNLGLYIRMGFVMIIIMASAFAMIQMAIYMARSLEITRKHVLISSIICYYAINVGIEAPIIFGASLLVASLDFTTSISTIGMELQLLLLIYGIVRLVAFATVSSYLVKNKVEVI